jgi:hypothetical protein
VDLRALRVKAAGWAVIKQWIAKRVTQLLGGLEEEVGSMPHCFAVALGQASWDVPVMCDPAHMAGWHMQRYPALLPAVDSASFSTGRCLGLLATIACFCFLRPLPVLQVLISFIFNQLEVDEVRRSPLSGVRCVELCDATWLGGVRQVVHHDFHANKISMPGLQEGHFRPTWLVVWHDELHP